MRFFQASNRLAWLFKESNDLPIVPKALMDKLTNFTLQNAGVRSDIREQYFVFL